MKALFLRNARVPELYINYYTLHYESENSSIWFAIWAIRNLKMNKLLSLILLLLISLPAFAVQIPYAKDVKKDRIVSATSADKESGPFKCLECDDELILRKGTKLAHHFAHKSDPNSTCTGGGPETYEHQLAKELLKDYLNSWKFIEECGECHRALPNLRYFPSAQGKTEPVAIVVKAVGSHPLKISENVPLG